MQMSITRIASQMYGTYAPSRMLSFRDQFQSGESKLEFAVLTAASARGAGMYRGAISITINKV